MEIEGKGNKGKQNQGMAGNLFQQAQPTNMFQFNNNNSFIESSNNQMGLENNGKSKPAKKGSKQKSLLEGPTAKSAKTKFINKMMEKKKMKKAQLKKIKAKKAMMIEEDIEKGKDWKEILKEKLENALQAEGNQLAFNLIRLFKEENVPISLCFLIF